MKTISILLIAMMLTAITFAQDEKKNLDEIKVTPPQFTGIMNAAEMYHPVKFASFEDYLSKNLIYPEHILRSGAEGTEVVHFKVSADGKLADFKVINSVSPEIDAAIYEMLKTTCGMWKPGETNGEPTSMEKEIAIEFKWKEFEEFNKTKDFDALARFYMKKGAEQFLVKNNPQKAMKHFNHGIKYRPNEDCLLMARGMCKYELGDKEGAQNDWNRMRTAGVDKEAIKLATNYENMKGYSDLAAVLNK